MSVLFLFSCSNSEDSQPDNQTAVIAKGKLLKSVIETGGAFGSEFCSFYYENNLLLKLNSGEKDNYNDKHQFKYENGKISKIAVKVDFGATNPDDFGYNLNFELDYIWTINYVGNKIFNSDLTFNLNNQKQVISITENNSLTNEFTYNNNQIIKQKHFGSGTRSGEYTFIYDEKTNPYYVLYAKFGLLNNSIYPLKYNNTIYYNFMPNNVTKVYLDGNLLCSFVYQYDNENYPLSVIQYDYTNKETRQFTYVYSK